MGNDTIIHALLVEDDIRLADLTREYLEKQGLAVSVIHDGDEGLKQALRGSYDVLLLDIMLPSRSGIEICQKVREHSDVPIVMLTARGEEADRVLGLEIGADDYMSKPFSPRELLARIRAVIRRARGKAGPRFKAITRGEINLDPGTREARLSGRLLELTGYEFSLLQALAERAGMVLSREQLMELAGGSAEESFDRSIDVHISRLRNKLGDDKKRPRLIKTVRGVGYQLVTSKGDKNEKA
jgi:DNA-binding response OmpR family regulator